MDISPYVSAIVTMAVFVIGGWIAMKNAFNEQIQGLKVDMSRVEQKVDDLRADVEKHNNLVERVATSERDIKTCYNQLDKLRERDDKLEAKVEKLHG